MRRVEILEVPQANIYPMTVCESGSQSRNMHSLRLSRRSFLSESLMWNLQWSRMILGASLRYADDVDAQSTKMPAYPCRTLRFSTDESFRTIAFALKSDHGRLRTSVGHADKGMPQRFERTLACKVHRHGCAMSRASWMRSNPACKVCEAYRKLSSSTTNKFDPTNVNSDVVASQEKRRRQSLVWTSELLQFVCLDTQRGFVGLKKGADVTPKRQRVNVENSKHLSEALSSLDKSRCNTIKFAPWSSAHDVAKPRGPPSTRYFVSRAIFISRNWA